jgi:hypothetical protein
LAELPCKRVVVLLDCLPAQPPQLAHGRVEHNGADHVL